MSQQPCLPVPRRRKRVSSEDESTSAFDNIESMDAMQYIQAVVEQANALPDVFVAQDNSRGVVTQQQPREEQYVPIEGSAASLSYLVSDRTAILPPPTDRHVPVSRRQWVDMTLSNFSRLRDYLDTCQQNGVGGKQSARQAVPLMRDRTGWHLFCVGRDEARGNVGSYFDASSDDDDDDDETESSRWRRDVPPAGHEPSVRLLLQMDQVMVRRVLCHLSYYVQEGWSPCTSQRSAWLYALLARLERPLHRDDAAMLYGLLKELTHVRAKLNVENDAEKLARVNLLIVIVGIYFEQGGGYDAVMSVAKR